MIVFAGGLVMIGAFHQWRRRTQRGFCVGRNLDV